LLLVFSQLPIYPKNAGTLEQIVFYWA